MKDFFNIATGARYHYLTLRQLALMVHDAEEQNDDITIMECYDELEHRKQQHSSSYDIFMDFYREEWKKRNNHYE